MNCEHTQSISIQSHRGTGGWTGLKLGNDQINQLNWCEKCGALLVDGKWLLPERDVTTETPTAETKEVEKTT